MKLNENVDIRLLTDSDKKEFIHLKLKIKDKIEVQKALGVTVKEYLEWHFSNHKEVTKGIFYKGKLVAFTGITDSGTICFLSSRFNKELKFTMVRVIKDIVDSEMDERGFSEVTAYVDAEYTEATKWIEHAGFDVSNTVEFEQGEFVVATYKRQIVGNTDVI